MTPTLQTLGIALLAFAAHSVAAQTAPNPLLGRNLAATCANCHGSNGQARGDMRPLAGVPADRLLAQLADFRSGAMPATIMHQIAKGYSEEQLRLIAAYFAAQPASPANPAAPAAQPAPSAR
jgi:sulfide dehydrogenase cytochrome subunit